LLVPALAALATGRKAGRGLSAPQRNTRLGAVITVVVLAAIVAFPVRKRLLAAWYADLGAVEMARVELAGFPTGEFEDGSRAADMAPAEALFQKALAYNQEDVTANHRLGLIALLRRDFPKAQAYLEVAQTGDPRHRGVEKNLAYCYVWNGQFDQAQRLLQDIPEGGQELEVYTWWWGTQGRPDLATRAEEMVRRLE
jgi:tetratricopeptide (TPR) repeat protein